MPINESLKKVREIIQLFLKSKKILRMYPSNNPVYINTLDDDFSKFKDFFYYHDDLTLNIRQNEILYESEQVYFNPEKEDNFAFFFFKDGLREITFRKGLTFEELEYFLKIISIDFNREELDDDIVTLFWERDFQSISYVVDDVVLTDEEDYETRAVAEIKGRQPDEDQLLKAYEDASRDDNEVTDVSVVPLSDKDLQLLLTELEMDSLDKTEKLLDILFEFFFISDTKEDYDELVSFFMHTIEYSIGRGDINAVTNLLPRIKQLAADRNVSEEIKKCAGNIIYLMGNEKIIGLLGEILDSSQEMEEKIIEDFIKYLDKNAIAPFMKVLGELKSIHARKIVIDALVFLGTKDIMTLAKGLSDSRWYVVRNIIYILRKIGDKRAVDYLLKTVKHGDIRVKKEVIRTLGELGGSGVLQALRDCLDDPEFQVRSASLKAFSNVGSEAARRIIMTRITERNFRDKDFDEKKEYFEALSRWKDKEVYEFLITTLKKRTFFGRAKNDENRACSAYCLGLICNRDALPLLNKHKNDSNKLLKEFTYTAIKRIESGQ